MNTQHAHHWLVRPKRGRYQALVFSGRCSEEVFRRQGILSRQRKACVQRQGGGTVWAVEGTGTAHLVEID